MKGEENLNVNVRLENGIIKQTKDFTYLGSVIADDGRSDTEIRQRIGMAKTAFVRMRTLLSNMSLSIELRVRVLRCYVWSIFLYGAETWTISAVMRNRIEAAEMWFYRRMLRISWVAHVTNEEVLRRVGKGRELMATVRERQLRFIGHVMREDDLEKIVITGRIEGTRARGRQRIKYMDSLMKDVREMETVGELIRTTEDRGRWRTVIADVRRDMALR